MAKKSKVEVTLGKATDLLRLKSNIVADFAVNSKKMNQLRQELLFSKNRLRRVTSCPVCSFSAKRARPRLTIYGLTYVQCPNCSHCFCDRMLTKTALERFYSQSVKYQSTWTDRKTAEIRLNQVAVPKVKWLLRHFRKLYHGRPRAILDVGAGSGHFVAACRQQGLQADGLELSQSGREFCRRQFGFDLLNGDFVKDWRSLPPDYEVVTFWGVIEHTLRPPDMLRAAAHLLRDKKGLVVAEVPRWNSFGTVVQTVFTDTVARHLDPLGHINCFTDESLGTAFARSGFKVTAAWYFGMDAYELLVQLSHLLGDTGLIDQFGRRLLPVLQQRIDLVKLSDKVVFAGVPRGKSRRII